MSDGLLNSFLCKLFEFVAKLSSHDISCLSHNYYSYYEIWKRSKFFLNGKGACGTLYSSPIEIKRFWYLSWSSYQGRNFHICMSLGKYCLFHQLYVSVIGHSYSAKYSKWPIIVRVTFCWTFYCNLKTIKGMQVWI